MLGGLLRRVTSAFLILRAEDLQKIPEPRRRKQLENQAPLGKKMACRDACHSNESIGNLPFPTHTLKALSQLVWAWTKRGENRFSPGGGTSKIQPLRECRALAHQA